MSNLDRTLRLAKAGSLSRAELYEQMKALAEEAREPGQSEAQAFSKFVSTEEGRQLLQIQKSLPGRDIEVGWQIPESVAKSAPGGDWEGLVSSLQRLQKCSRSKAIDAALLTPEGMYLFKQQKRSEQIGTGQFTKADMAALDGEVEAQAEIHKRASNSMSEFERMVANVRRAKPQFSESKAQDHVRSTADGMKAWIAHKGQPGMNGLTMTDDPARISQWDSPHSGSRYTPPTGTPRRASDIRPGPDDEPAIKRWYAMVKRMSVECNFTQQRATEILKVLPEGRKVWEQVLAEAARM